MEFRCLTQFSFLYQPKREKVAKMKNKLGTRQLPTAELLLDGTKATMVGEEGRGIASISSMLTITRSHLNLFFSKIIFYNSGYTTPPQLSAQCER